MLLRFVNNVDLFAELNSHPQVTAISCLSMFVSLPTGSCDDICSQVPDGIDFWS